MFFKPVAGNYLFAANLWLLSYPHTVATYQRSYFRTRSKKFFTFIIFICIFFINVAVYKTWDLVALMNGYFYLQFIHYFRQNFGISKINSKDWDEIDTALFHLVSFSALLSLWNGEVTFLGYGLWSFKVFNGQEYVFFAVLALTLLKLFIDAFNKKKKAPMVYIHIILLTITVSIPRYFLLGWLGLHLFHNIQYIYLNWKLNSRHSFLWSYIKTVAVVVTLYHSAYKFDKLMYYFIPFSFIMILSVNYTHYFFDTYLWKKKYREQFP